MIMVQKKFKQILELLQVPKGKKNGGFHNKNFLC
jgi:hypothetical protein